MLDSQRMMIGIGEAMVGKLLETGSAHRQIHPSTITSKMRMLGSRRFYFRNETLFFMRTMRKLLRDILI